MGIRGSRHSTPARQQVHHKQVHQTHKPVASKHASPIKRTWQSGPASLPPVTEVIPARPAASPPRVSAARDSHTKVTALASANQHRTPATHPVRTATLATAATVQPAPKVNTNQPDAAAAVDPEAQRVQDEFARLRADAVARRAFYDDLLRTVERVRAGTQSESPVEEKPVSFQPVTPPPAKDLIEPVSPPRAPERAPPMEAPPTRPPAPQSSLGPYGSQVNTVAYQRVVRWAKANDAPVALALGVAWMESRLNTNAPHGTSGEVGMFQIMPERCRLEGWPSDRLNEPEFNAWLGTVAVGALLQGGG